MDERERVCSSLGVCSLGELIRVLRLQKGLSQEELAESMGVVLPYLEKVERDEAVPTNEQCLRLEEILNYEPYKLVFLAQMTRPSMGEVWFGQTQSRRRPSVEELRGHLIYFRDILPEGVYHAILEIVWECVRYNTPLEELRRNYL